MTPPFRELDTVVLKRDLPEAGLRAGDLGAVVQVYGPDALEVEIVTASGRTPALRTLDAADVRAVGDDDVLAVRPAPPMRGGA
jgi:ketosteroid isomerase-like protein